MVVAAHPDDEVLGAGGTIARHRINQDSVTILILGEGVTSRYSERKDAEKKALDRLRTHALRASEILGVSDTRFLSFPDNRFDTVALLDIVKQVETVKSSVKPEVVYTHHGGDLNIDHRITLEAVMTAFRPQPGERACEILSFEVGSSTDWAAPSASTVFLPNTYFDITATLDLKIKAMAAYKTESKSYPHPRSSKAIRSKAAVRGTESGLHFAEAFQLVRKISAY